jgi:hypothetical protein
LERRTKPRFRADLACRLYRDGKEIRGQLLDIADGGLSVRISAEAAEGDVFRIVILRPGSPRVEVDGLLWHSHRLRLASGRTANVVGLVLSASSPEYEAMVAARADFKERLATPVRTPAPPLRPPLHAAPPRSHRPLAPPDPGLADQLVELAKAAADAELPEFEFEAESEEVLTSMRLFRIRMGLGSRTRSLSIGAKDEEEARAAATESFGSEWSVLEISAR